MAFADFIAPLAALGGAAVGALTNASVARHKTTADSVATARDDRRDDFAVMSTQWQSMLDSQRIAIIDPMQAQINNLTEEVGLLKGALNGVQVLYRVSLNHNRELRTRWPNEHRADLPELPAPLLTEI